MNNEWMEDFKPETKDSQARLVKTEKERLEKASSLICSAIEPLSIVYDNFYNIYSDSVIGVPEEIASLYLHELIGDFIDRLNDIDNEITDLVNGDEE